MASGKEVAEWMAAQFDTASYVYQETVVYKTRKQFGADFVYLNANVISQSVKTSCVSFARSPRAR